MYLNCTRSKEVLIVCSKREMQSQKAILVLGLYQKNIKLKSIKFFFSTFPWNAETIHQPVSTISEQHSC